MKTVFTKGMTVYDNVFFPNSKGEVVRIDKHYDSERVIVRFDNWDSEASYTEIGRLDKAINWLRDKGLHKISLEEAKAVYFTPKENYAVFDALRRLIILRDYYNEGWKPDWRKEREMKYVIYNDAYKLATIQSYTMSFILAFKDGNIRGKFFREQRELLEIAKPLL